MSDPIVDRIDALVRKRRSFVAASAGTARPVVVPAVDEDDIPVLTEIVDITEVSGDAPETAAAPPLQPMLAALADDLSQCVADRLAADLPEILDAALEQFRSDLRRGIAGSVDSAARDFLARRQQLRLPFPTDSADR